MTSSGEVFVISLDENGEIIGVSMNGEPGKECEDWSRGDPRVVWYFGEDPANGNGVEFLEYETMRCYHHFCKTYCW